MPGMMSRSLEDVARRLETVFGPWSHVDESQTWDLREGALSLVRVYGVSGAISVLGASGDRASLHVRKVIHIPQVGAAESFASRIRVRFNVRDQRLWVRILHPRPPLGGRVFVHLELQVPHAVDVALRASRGPISVHGIEGAVQAHTRTGNIRARDCLGSMRLETGDGIIDAGEVEGSVALQCGRGAVRLDAITGEVRLRADRADVAMVGIRGRLDAQVRQGSLRSTGGSGTVRLRTGEGDVQAALGAGHRDVTMTNHQGHLALSLGAVEGGVRAATSQGDVELMLKPAFAGRIEAFARAGHVHTALSGADRRELGNRLDVHVGGSSAAHVWVASAEGDIRIDGTPEGVGRQQDEEGKG